MKPKIFTKEFRDLSKRAFEPAEIDWIGQQISSKSRSAKSYLKQYKIPITTSYKWSANTRMVRIVNQVLVDLVLSPKMTKKSI